MDFNNCRELKVWAACDFGNACLYPRSIYPDQEMWVRAPRKRRQQKAPVALHQNSGRYDLCVVKRFVCWAWKLFALTVIALSAGRLAHLMGAKFLCGAGHSWNLIVFLNSNLLCRQRWSGWDAFLKGLCLCSPTFTRMTICNSWLRSAPNEEVSSQEWSI